MPLAVVGTLKVYSNNDTGGILQKYNVYALQTNLIPSFWCSDDDNGYASDMRNKSASFMSMNVYEAALLLIASWLGCNW